MNKNKGYIGQRMSVNALNAHATGKKPLSEWHKEDFDCLFSEELRPYLKKLTLKELKSHFLKYSVWHHTGKFFNVTDFYELDEDKAEELTAERLQKIIENRPPREKKQKEKPLYVTAKITFTEWVGRFANFKKPVKRVEVVHFMSNEKLVELEDGTKKRLSSVVVLEKIEQKTKFANANRLK